jgi:hypothetical protein
MVYLQRAAECWQAGARPAGQVIRVDEQRGNDLFTLRRQSRTRQPKVLLASNRNEGAGP